MKPDPVELVKIAGPVALEAVCVSIMLAGAILWTAIWSGQL